MGDRLFVTGLWPSQSDRGPTFKVLLNYATIQKFKVALEQFPDGELTIWPTRDPQPKGPTATLSIGPRQQARERPAQPEPPPEDDSIPF